jgi:hypothetical protein
MRIWWYYRTFTGLECQVSSPLIIPWNYFDSSLTFLGVLCSAKGEQLDHTLLTTLPLLLRRMPGILQQ